MLLLNLLYVRHQQVPCDATLCLLQMCHPCPATPTGIGTQAVASSGARIIIVKAWQSPSQGGCAQTLKASAGYHLVLVPCRWHCASWAGSGARLPARLPRAVIAGEGEPGQPTAARGERASPGGAVARWPGQAGGAQRQLEGSTGQGGLQGVALKPCC